MIKTKHLPEEALLRLDFKNSRLHLFILSTVSGNRLYSWGIFLVSLYSWQRGGKKEINLNTPHSWYRVQHISPIPFHLYLPFNYWTPHYWPRAVMWSTTFYYQSITQVVKRRKAKNTVCMYARSMYWLSFSVRDHGGKSWLINPIAVLWPAVNPVCRETAITKQLRKLPLDV